MKRLNSIRGLTLTEVMISTVIMTFIIAGLYTTLLAGHVSWETHEVAIRAQREARKVVDVLTRDLRAGQGILVNQTSGSLALAFSIPDTGAVNYSWSNTGTNANQIIRQTSSSSRIVAQDISVFSVTDGAADVAFSVTATSTSAKGETNNYQLFSKVAKR